MGLLHSTSEEKNPDQRRTRTVSVQSTSPPSSPSEEGAELTADSLGAHRISSVFSHLRRQKKDRNPPPIDESLGIDGVSSDLSRLPPIRQLSRSSRRLVRRFSSSPTCDDSISPPGVSSSGRQCLQFGDQLLLVVWYGYRLIDHNVVELNNVHRQIITIRKEHEVRKLNLKAKHEEKMRQAQIQFLWLLSASPKECSCLLRMALTLALRRSSKVFLFMFLPLEIRLDFSDEDESWHKEGGVPRLIVIVPDLWIRKGETNRGLQNLDKEGGGKVYGQFDLIDLSSKYEGNSKSGFKRSYRDQDTGYLRNLRQTGRFPQSEAPMRYAIDTRGLKNINTQEMGQNLDEQQKLMLDAFRSGKSEETNQISDSTARKALSFEGNISGTAMEGLGGTDVASGIAGASVGEEDPKALKEKLLPERHEESEGEKIEEMEGLSEEIDSELTGDVALTETGEQDGSEHVGDEVFAEADFDVEEDDQLMETETQEVLIESEGKERGRANKKKQGKVNGAAMGGSLKKRLVQSVVSPRKKHTVKKGSKVGEKDALPPEKAPCNGMFLFWTRHFAITIFIEIIKEHQLLQIVMKHLNWRNGYWLVLSCIKNMLSPVEYQVCTCLYCPDDSFFAGLLCSFELRWKSFFQGQMRLVSCGGIYIYMAKSHTEHRALVSWPMGLSGDHWCYITREMNGSSWSCWIRLFATEFIEIVKVFQPFKAVMESFNWCTVFWLVLSCAKNRSLLGDYHLFCFSWRFGVCLSSDGILLDMCHCVFLSIWIHWWFTTSYCPGAYLADGGWHLRKRMEDMALHSFCKTYTNPYMGHQSMEWSIYGSYDLRKDNLNYAKHYISVVLWRRDLKNLQMQIKCLDDRKTLSAYILVCRVTASVKIKHFYDLCVEIRSSKDKICWVMGMHCFLFLDFGPFVSNDVEILGSLSMLGVWSQMFLQCIWFVIIFLNVWNFGDYMMPLCQSLTAEVVAMFFKRSDK
ncbi:hypothetical protein HID58_069970 [Brassica napus]|uniref:Uncharacterized protein n=1 Tax=Brassica napus TaxID=3708 RepID=A0ABQ7YXI1_BRANA|nr:hypothetical protein HID58_069970 [Brassica napus]